MKKIIIFFFFVLSFNNLAYASEHLAPPKNFFKETVKVDKFTEKNVIILHKKTNLSTEDIYNYLNKGLNIDDIQSIYILHYLSFKKMEDVWEDYIIDEYNLNEILSDYKISKDKYDEAFKNIFEK